MHNHIWGTCWTAGHYCEEQVRAPTLRVGDIVLGTDKHDCSKRKWCVVEYTHHILFGLCGQEIEVDKGTIELTRTPIFFESDIERPLAIIRPKLLTNPAHYGWWLTDMRILLDWKSCPDYLEMGWVSYDLQKEFNHDDEEEKGGQEMALTVNELIAGKTENFAEESTLPSRASYCVTFNSYGDISEIETTPGELDYCPGSLVAKEEDGELAWYLLLTEDYGYRLVDTLHGIELGDEFYDIDSAPGFLFCVVNSDAVLLTKEALDEIVRTTDPVGFDPSTWSRNTLRELESVWVNDR